MQLNIQVCIVHKDNYALPIYRYLEEDAVLVDRAELTEGKDSHTLGVEETHSIREHRGFTLAGKEFVYGESQIVYCSSQIYSSLIPMLQEIQSWEKEAHLLVQEKKAMNSILLAKERKEPLDLNTYLSQYQLEHKPSHILALFYLNKMTGAYQVLHSQFFPFETYGGQKEKRQEGQNLDRTDMIHSMVEYISQYMQDPQKANMTLTQKEAFLELESWVLASKESDSFTQKEIQLFLSLAKEKMGVNVEGSLAYQGFQILCLLGMTHPDKNYTLRYYQEALTQDDRFHVYPYEVQYMDTSYSEMLKEDPHFFEHADNMPRVQKHDLFTFTVDGDMTQDFDDAFSVEIHEYHYKIWVHIADVSAYIPYDSPLDHSLMQRWKSLYLGYEEISLLPQEIQALASLEEGKIRKALSFVFLFSKDFDYIDMEIHNTEIQIDHNFRYKDSAFLVEKYPEIQVLVAGAQKLQSQRLKQGAVELAVPQVQLKYKEGEWQYELIDFWNEGFLFVKEWMILTNQKVGKWMQEQMIPTIYLSQKWSESRNPAGKVIESTEEIVYWMKIFRKSVFSTYDSHHLTLGLRNYTQLTSPIRRYLDICMHRQLKYWIYQHQCLYSFEELESFLPLMQERQEKLGEIEKNSFRHSLMVYLKTYCIEKVFDAYIVKKIAPKVYLVHLLDFRISIKMKTKELLYPLQRVSVRISEVIPFLQEARSELVSVE